MFGHELILPVDLIYGVSQIQQEPQSVSEYARTVVEQGENAFEVVRENVKKVSVGVNVVNCQ